MPARVTPRNLAGNARIEMDGQRDDLKEVIDIFKEMDASFDAWYHHAMRRLAACNQKRREAVKALDALQAAEESVVSGWDGRAVAA